MKKRIVVVICACILIISTLCACEITFGQNPTTSTTTTTTTKTFDFPIEVIIPDAILTYYDSSKGGTVQASYEDLYDALDEAQERYSSLTHRDTVK